MCITRKWVCIFASLKLYKILVLVKCMLSHVERHNTIIPIDKWIIFDFRYVFNDFDCSKKTVEVLMKLFQVIQIEKFFRFLENFDFIKQIKSGLTKFF